MVTEAFILDAVRTPRGRGRPNGSLHEVAPVRLAATVLSALKTRHEMDTSLVNDVVLGCVEASAARFDWVPRDPFTKRAREQEIVPVFRQKYFVVIAQASAT